MIGLALVAFVLIPSVVNAQLEKRSQAIAVADRREAKRLKKTLFRDMLVRLFAPEAWSTLQKAQVYLKLSDGKSAAKWFAETAKLCRAPDAVMLVSAQAHAHVVAGDRKKARELLKKLAKAKLLGPRDQLDLGIVLLSSDLKRNRQAIAYIEAAQKTIGDHPRVIAALALGLQRAERIDEASEMLEKAQICLQDDEDPVVETLVKRARQGLRRYIEAQLRRERRARSRRTTIVVTSEHAVTVSGEIGGKGGLPDLAQVEALRARGWSADKPRPIETPKAPEPEPAVASTSGTGFEIDLSEGDTEVEGETEATDNATEETAATPEAVTADVPTPEEVEAPAPSATEAVTNSDAVDVDVDTSETDTPTTPADSNETAASDEAATSDANQDSDESDEPSPATTTPSEPDESVAEPSGPRVDADAPTGDKLPGLTIPRLVPDGVLTNGRAETTGPKLQSATEAEAGAGFFRAAASGDRLKPPPISEVSERGARLFRATPLNESEPTPEPEQDKADAKPVRPGRGLGAAFGIVPPSSSSPVPAATPREPSDAHEA